MDKPFKGLETYLTEFYTGWEGAKQFEGSGNRLERLYKEMCWPPEDIKIEVQKQLKSVFKDPYDEMLVSAPTSVWVLCPHHLLPCHFQVHIGYIPTGLVLGLSKFSRIAVTLGRRPIMQETYTRDVADTIMEGLKPEGVGVYVVGSHGCIGCRGVGQEVGISTAVLGGSFKSDPTVRKEFYDHLLLRGVKA